MYSVWTKHLKEEKKQEQFKNSVLGSKQVLDRAVEILKVEEEKLTREEIDPKNYGSGYAYYQAHLNGVRSGLRKAQDLLNLDQQNKGIIKLNDQFN